MTKISMSRRDLFDHLQMKAMSAEGYHEWEWTVLEYEFFGQEDSDRTLPAQRKSIQSLFKVRLSRHLTLHLTYGREAFPDFCLHLGGVYQPPDFKELLGWYLQCGHAVLSLMKRA